MQNSSYVHIVETTGENIDPCLYRDVIRKHCRLEYVATEQLYQALDNIECSDRVFQLKNCRTRAWFVRNRLDGTIRVASNSCRLRWCPLCAKSRANYIRHEVTAWFQTADHPKFLTVTIQHSKKPLADQINHIYDAFRKFRKDKFFKRYCNGGLWFFQICWNPDRREWHPHIHAIITGQYMDYRELRRIWERCTGDSKILDIRPVTDPKKVGDYVARYAARPCKLSSLPSRQGQEAITALYGRRMAGSWGSARCVSFRPRKIPDPENWEYMGGWSIVHHLASYDERAKAIIKAYYCNDTLPDGYSCYEFEAFIDDIGTMEADKLEIDPKPPPQLF